MPREFELILRLKVKVSDWGTQHGRRPLVSSAYVTNATVIGALDKLYDGELLTGSELDEAAGIGVRVQAEITAEEAS